MQYLIDFAEEESIKRITEVAAEYPVVQGLVLDVDRYWLRCWHSEFGYTARTQGIEPMYPEEWWRPTSPYVYAYPLTIDYLEGWRPPDWDGYLKSRQLDPEAGPVVAKVCMRPSESGVDRVPALEKFQDREDLLRVVFELRSVAELASDGQKNPLHRAWRPMPGGVSVGAGDTDFGTLCVTLRDQAHKDYAITCAHIVPHGNDAAQPAARDSKKSSRIGSSIAASALAECTQNDDFNPWLRGVSNEHDISLIEIDASQAGTLPEVLDIGPLSKISKRSSLSPAQAVEVMGRTSHRGALQIGGVALWYKFKHGDKQYCFRNLFEVESPSGTAAVRPVRHGDSGAPVCTVGPGGTNWCGMIVGCDYYKGFAIFSETIESWWQDEGYSLSIT